MDRRLMERVEGDWVVPPINEIAQLVDEWGDPGMDVEAAEEARRAAVCGRWWDIELECTRRRRSYQPEMEL